MHDDMTHGSPKRTKAEIDLLTERIIGAAIKVHQALGPGLLESTYEACMQFELTRQGVFIDLGILARRRTEHQQLEAHPNLVQQRTPARAARSQMDAGLENGRGRVGSHGGIIPKSTPEKARRSH